MTAEAPAIIDGRSRRRDRSAERLYDAADRLLSERSFDDITVDEVCALAGVGRATFFRIFQTKAGLLREFNRRLADDARSRLDSLEGVGLAAELHEIRATVVDAWRYAGKGHVGMAQEFARSTRSSNLHAAHPELLALVTESIQRAIASGEVTATVPAELAASLAVINITSAIAWAIAGHSIDIDELSRVLVDQWLAGSTGVTARRSRT